MASGGPDPKHLDPSQYKVQTYAVMDGINVTWSEKIKEWFRPHLRFLYYVHSANVGAWNEGSLTLFIVGSPKLEGTSFDAFLQVASWDSTLQEFRFYAVRIFVFCNAALYVYRRSMDQKLTNICFDWVRGKQSIGMTTRRFTQWDGSIWEDLPMPLAKRSHI